MANENQKPILAIKCRKCGAVYMAQALLYPIQQETAECIADCVRQGDEPFITYDEVRLSMCKCDDTDQSET